MKMKNGIKKHLYFENEPIDDKGGLHNLQEKR